MAGSGTAQAEGWGGAECFTLLFGYRFESVT